ncbi:MAG: alpha-2,8-polysialyltransferase family protein [Candidatus Gastranaerophilales bacterium]|nr:alpha-2,8-polysialyltransferase family protein [Candidatus Gastranaerophilales bacterium]
MKQIILMGDILFHSELHLKKVSWWVLKLFIPVVKDVVKDVNITFDIKNNDGKSFSREYFYKLGGIENVKPRYQEYDIKEFNDKQIDYLKQFFNKKTIVIGFELYKNFSDLLGSFGCTVIDFAFHPYKLFDDLTYGICTNDKEIYKQLLKYQIPQDKFYFYANYWSVFMQMHEMINDEDLENNSILFIGQTLIDKSVEKDGQFLNITHFEDKLKELSKKYSKIYYLPHPYLGRHRKLIYDFVKKCPYTELITNRSTYGLLASDKIKYVVGISTSVLYEAQYFNKEVEYLYKPLFNIDVPFEEHSYISVLDDYFNPKFWADILHPVCDVKDHVKDVNYFKNSYNKIRNVQDMYWGYAQLDPIKRIPNTFDGIKQFYMKYIAPLV